MEEFQRLEETLKHFNRNQIVQMNHYHQSRTEKACVFIDSRLKEFSFT